MRATRTFTDEKLKKNRKNGEEWLISIEDTETHIPNVYEEVCSHLLTIGLQFDIGNQLIFRNSVFETV